MRKNKGLFFIVAILLAVTCLFISCSAEVSENAGGGDKLVYATFDNGSKAAINPHVTISYDLIDLNQAYWIYTATKNDGGGKTGEGTFAVSSTLEKGLSGTIGPFSVGSWTFSVVGYKTKSQTDPGNVEKVSFVVDNVTWYLYDRVFEGTNASVSLTTGTESAPAPIDMTVYLVTDGQGQLVLDKNFKFAWDGTGGATELQMKITGIATIVNPITLTKSGDYYTFGTADLVYNVAAGDYTLNVSISYTYNNGTPEDTSDDVEYTVATVSDLAVKIYGGQTTRIEAAVLEGNFVYATINASLKSTATTTTVVDTAPTTFVTSYTPASVKSGSVSATEVTTVEFEAGAIASTGTGEQDITEYILTTNVSDLETAQNRGFEVTAGSSAAGSIDLSLKKIVGTSDPVDAEITGNVRIVTYIATNLSDVNVHYDGTGAAPTNVEYDPTTGRLSFVTTHFSEYYVTTTSEAYNSNKVKAYNSLRSALDDAASNDTIVLLKNADLGAAYKLTKSVTILGQGFEVRASSATDGYASGTEGRVFDLNGVTGINVYLADLNIIGEASAVRGISLYQTTNVNLTLSNCSVWANYYAINIASANTGLHVTLKNTTTANGWCAIQSWSPGVVVNIEGGELIGINNKPYNAEGWNGFSTIVINNSATDNTWNITDCKIKATQTTGNSQTFLSFRTTGSNVTCTNCTFILDDVDITDDLQEVVNNINFTSWDAVNNTHLEINGEIILDPTN